jgi:hypothetical protein
MRKLLMSCFLLCCGLMLLSGCPGMFEDTPITGTWWIAETLLPEMIGEFSFEIGNNGACTFIYQMTISEDVGCETRIPGLYEFDAAGEQITLRFDGIGSLKPCEDEGWDTQWDITAILNSEKAGEASGSVFFRVGAEDVESGTWEITAVNTDPAGEDAPNPMAGNWRIEEALAPDVFGLTGRFGIRFDTTETCEFLYQMAPANGVRCLTRIPGTFTMADNAIEVSCSGTGSLRPCSEDPDQIVLWTIDASLKMADPGIARGSVSADVGESYLLYGTWPATLVKADPEDSVEPPPEDTGGEGEGEGELSASNDEGDSFTVQRITPDLDTLHERPIEVNDYVEFNIEYTLVSEESGSITVYPLSDGSYAQGYSVLRMPVLAGSRAVTPFVALSQPGIVDAFRVEMTGPNGVILSLDIDVDARWEDFGMD